MASMAMQLDQAWALDIDMIHEQVVDVHGKHKPRGRNRGCCGYGNNNMDGLNELNRGLRGRVLRTKRNLHRLPSQSSCKFCQQM